MQNEEEADALRRYRSATEVLEDFWDKNPGLYEHIKDMLQEQAEALTHVEALARRKGATLGPVVAETEGRRVNPKALATWVAAEPEGEKRLREMGGDLQQVPRLTADQVRQAVVKGLLSSEEGASLAPPYRTFHVPATPHLPPRRNP